MRPCDIDVERSPRFKREFQEFQGQYPKTIDDIKGLFENVAKDPRGTARGRIQIGDEREVYKYYCKSSDLRKGANKAYRIIAFYEPDRALVTPLAMYLKSRTENIPVREVLLALEALRDRAPPPPALP